MSFSARSNLSSLEGWCACTERLPPVAAEVSVAYIARAVRKSIDPRAYTYEHEVMFDGLRWVRRNGEPIYSRWRVDYWTFTSS